MDKNVKLQCGRYSLAQIAAWMNVSANAIYHNKDKYLEKLKEYAVFHTDKTKIVITEVLQEEFVADAERDLAMYLQEAKSANENICTLKSMAKKLHAAGYCANIKEDSLARRLSKAGEKGFGKTRSYKNADAAGGLYGHRQYVWAVKLDENQNRFRHLTAKERELFEKYVDKYNKSQLNDFDSISDFMLLFEAFRDGEIDAKEFQDTVVNISNYKDFYSALSEFMREAGVIVVRATEHEINF